MNEYEADIIRTETRGRSIFVLDIQCGDIARTAVPGQFVQIRVAEGTDPFLRRTFSIAGCDPAGETVRLMVDVVGHGTRALCGMGAGESLGIIGPLGKGFDPAFGGNDAALLVGGGVGAAPLLFLVRGMNGRKSVFLMGGRSAGHVAMVDGLVPNGVPVRYATDDGSRGYHGLITGLLEEELTARRPAVIYACGPHPMMRVVAGIARREGIPCQVSLEERMACGIGACLGCAVQLTGDRMVRACADGPVFDAEEVVW